jgi:hypothetical protein
VSAVIRLRPTEHIDVDSHVVADLFRRVGPLVAEDMLIASVERLTDQLATLDADRQTVGLCGCRHVARDMARQASDMGLHSLSTALGALADADTHANDAALPALWERVKRIGDRSLVQLWELPQLQL